MSILLFIFILIPIGVISVFTYKSYKKLPHEYDMKTVRRVYYIISLLWIILFCKIFKKYIDNALNFTVTYFVDEKVLKFILTSCFLMIIVMIFDSIFISCIRFKNLKIKDVEITLQEAQEIKYINQFEKKEKFALYNVLDAKVEMIKHIDKVVSENKVVNDELDYINVLSKYSEYRKDVLIDCYYESHTLFDTLLERYTEFNEQQWSSIIYTVDLCGFCVPNLNGNQVEKKTQYLIARINTKYSKEDIITVLYGDFLIDSEHIVLIDIVNYLERVIEISILDQ